ncbi:MAG: ribosome biogenesis GTPase Der [Armatimonadetes bacterium]|nr:ribosome biogenesis GTPase Der [Armatimonadota bacterium]
MQKPVIAIVGRPNVGKSTLFNRLIRERKAIVEDQPGITRDRLYGEFDWNGREFTVIDTGGIVYDEPDPILQQTRQQAEVAMSEADLILLLVDTKDGPTAVDYDLATTLRKSQKPILLVANKADGERLERETTDFYSLGLGEVYPVSSIHGRGLGDLLDVITERLPAPEISDEEEIDAIKIALIGRPNVGKSSLTNAILGEARSIVSEIPGTTRDAIDTLFEREDQRFLLIDTAGIRRAGKIGGTVEYYTVLRAQRSIERCDVAITIIDAVEGPTDGDARVSNMAHEAGKGSIIVVNKWDLVKNTQMHEYAKAVQDQFRFMEYAPIGFTSAKTGRGIAGILDTVVTVAENHALRIPTGELNRVIREAIEARPHTHKRKELKVYYATMVRVKPPSIALFVNDPKLVHFSYERYLMNRLRDAFGFVGTPIRLHFRQSRDH